MSSATGPAAPGPAATVPWVIGQWVRGELFYGREAELDALGDALRSGGERLWLAGLRRIGKTSILRQIELLALDGTIGRPPVLPVYWDLEGVDGPRELALSLDDALLDAGEAFERLGLDPPATSGDDPAARLERLGSRLAALGPGRRGAELLLLCDEVDRLTALATADPGEVTGLWRAVAGAGRVVIASSVRLADLAAGGDPAAAEVVEGFGEPLPVGALSPAESRDLLLQSRLPEAARPALGDAAVETIRDACGDHPMLLQLAGRRCQETGDAAEAIRRVAAERTVDHLFEVDLELLTGAERRALEGIAAAERGAAAGSGLAGSGRAGFDASDPGLGRLLALGLLRAVPGGVELRNRLLAAWLLR